MYAIAKEITDQQAIDFEILKPLLLETAHKVLEQDPKAMQTGPAIRGDQKTMERHLDFLKQYPDWAQLYKLISAGIIKS